jgi:hypothetical protein
MTRWTLLGLVGQLLDKMLKGEKRPRLRSRECFRLRRSTNRQNRMIGRDERTNLRDAFLSSAICDWLTIAGQPAVGLARRPASGLPRYGVVALMDTGYSTSTPVSGPVVQHRQQEGRERLLGRWPLQEGVSRLPLQQDPGNRRAEERRRYYHGAHWTGADQGAEEAQAARCHLQPDRPQD